ncbi:hypothetical protein [Novosphingobium sp. PhB165]|uniref:hypothetical protein n=1 Tax=Novosphingobium sp. PhB165 TaxID=2485105 RepID=UPI00104932B2|nr:hypothetical protein [Novosphingobium sp. PhB165]
MLQYAGSRCGAISQHDVCPADRSVFAGEAKGKSSFGTYTGFKPFFVADSTVVALESADFSAAMGRCYGNHASKSVPPEVTARTLKSAGAVASKVPSTGPSRFPYTAPDGVTITNAADEANWKKYRTTQPDGGE